MFRYMRSTSLSDECGRRRTLTFHRKVAVSFRDLALFHIFQIALTTLQQLLQRQVTVESPQQEFSLNMHTLQLVKLCLTFDFIGTCPEESTEDTTSVQVPASWREVIQDPATMQLLFDVHKSGEPAHQKVALECLVQMASIRRSLFGEDAQRALYLTHLMNGTMEIMQNQRGLQDQDNFHVFCRLLSRLKANNQLAEIIQSEGYATWIELLSKFTIASFNSWEWASNSIFYLLSLWSRLVSPLHLPVSRSGPGCYVRLALHLAVSLYLAAYLAIYLLLIAVLPAGHVAAIPQERHEPTAEICPRGHSPPSPPSYRSP